jgi:hypothetical protein
MDEQDQTKDDLPQYGPLGVLGQTTLTQNSWGDRLFGILFSFVVSLLLASAIVVFIVNQNSNVSTLLLIDIFIGSVIAFTIVIAVLRRYVKGFGIILAIVLFLLFLFGVLYATLSVAASTHLCNKLGGSSVLRNPEQRHSGLDRICLVPQDVYNTAIKNKTYLYSITSFAVKQ